MEGRRAVIRFDGHDAASREREKSKKEKAERARRQQQIMLGLQVCMCVYVCVHVSVCASVCRARGVDNEVCACPCVMCQVTGIAMPLWRLEANYEVVRAKAALAAGRNPDSDLDGDDGIDIPPLAINPDEVLKGKQLFRAVAWHIICECGVLRCAQCSEPPACRLTARAVFVWVTQRCATSFPCLMKPNFVASTRAARELSRTWLYVGDNEGVGRSPAALGAG